MSADPSNPRTALVADDDAIARSVMSSMLEEAGYSVVGEAKSAVEALEMAKAHEPDLLLLDVSMPGRSGLDVLPHVKRDVPTCDVIIVSSFELPRVEAAALGALAAIDKAEIHLLFDLLEDLSASAG